MPYAAIVAKPLRLLCSRIGFDHVNCYKMKLTRYWARLGFKLLENGLMVMDTTSTRPPMSQVLRKTKMPRCKRTKSVSYRVLVPTP
jgi:hypothetical protein